MYALRVRLETVTEYREPDGYLWKACVFKNHIDTQGVAQCTLALMDLGPNEPHITDMVRASQ